MWNYLSPLVLRFGALYKKTISLLGGKTKGEVIKVKIWRGTALNEIHNSPKSLIKIWTQRQMFYYICSSQKQVSKLYNLFMWQSSDLNNVSTVMRSEGYERVACILHFLIIIVKNLSSVHRLFIVYSLYIRMINIRPPSSQDWRFWWLPEHYIVLLATIQKPFTVGFNFLTSQSCMQTTYSLEVSYPNISHVNIWLSQLVKSCHLLRLYRNTQYFNLYLNWNNITVHYLSSNTEIEKFHPTYQSQLPYQWVSKHSYLKTHSFQH